jgi:hypothetical protein
MAERLVSSAGRFARGAFFATSLILLACLLGCTAEPTSPATASRGGAGSFAATAGPDGNHPPVVRSAKIFPIEVTLGDTLRVEIQGEDLDGDPVTYQYQWVVNGFSVPGATAPQFSAEKLRRGDRVGVELTPNDGKVNGAVFKTDPVTVGNTAPEIEAIYLEPVPLHRGDPLYARIVARDPDGDPIQFTYRWFRNGKEIPGAVAGTLETTGFRKKDLLGVLVTASDGKATQAPRGSAAVTIENAPPRFTSTPTGTIKDGQFEYQVKAVDPDDDPVTFELKQAPPGMTLDAATGRLLWKITPESKGKHHVVIVAKDNDNGVTPQEFELEGVLTEPAGGP